LRDLFKPWPARLRRERPARYHFDLQPRETMNNHYLLPVCCAVAAHGALLFGFTKNPRPARLIKVATEVIPCDLRPPPEEEAALVEEPERGDSARTIALDDPPPRQSEPLVIPVAELMVITPPNLPPVRVGITPAADGPFSSGTKPHWGTVLPGSMLDNSPRTRFQPAPLYPHAAKQAGLRGEVVVEYIVDEYGRVVDPRIVSSSDRVFEDATLKAVAKWQFEPGRRAGAIVSFRMMVPVVFNLTD
jgi:protein TonB